MSKLKFKNEIKNLKTNIVLLLVTFTSKSVFFIKESVRISGYKTLAKCLVYLN